MDDPISFLASFPPIQSAIKRDGSGGGMRIQLDIPESEMSSAVMLLALTQERLRVTVEVDGQTEAREDDKPAGDNPGITTTRRRAAKRRI